MMTGQPPDIMEQSVGAGQGENYPGYHYHRLEHYKSIATYRT